MRAWLAVQICRLVASTYDEVQASLKSAVPGTVVQRALDQAIASGDSHFSFPPSVAFPDSADLTILGARNMVLEGAPGGTTLWFSPPTGGFRVMSCSNITVRQLIVDYAPLPYIQADIINVSGNKTSPVYTFQLVQRSLDFMALNGSLGPIAQSWLWTGQGDKKWATGRVRMPASSQLRQVQPGVYVTEPGFPGMNAKVGDSVTYMLRQAHTYVIGNSSNVTSEDVTTLSALGLNFYELDGEGAHVYRRIKVSRRPGYMIGSNADCFHSIDVAHGPTIIDSELGYCLDDFFNIHNTVHVLYPPEVVGDTSHAMLVNPRIGAPHLFRLNSTIESNRTLDETYGYTSPMSNIRVGKDTLRCYAFNSYGRRLGDPLVVQSATILKDKVHTSRKLAQDLQAILGRLGVRSIGGWWDMEVWNVSFAPGALNGWNTSGDPALMCDVQRFSASGSSIVNTSFHHTSCNLGRMKASNSRIVNNTFQAPVGIPNLEIVGLQNWMEGPMLINSVHIEGNVFKGLGWAKNLIHAGHGASNITISANEPSPKAEIATFV